MSAKYHVRAREFLNKRPEMRAYIIGVVEDTRSYADCFEDGWKWGRIELRMADCFGEIAFEFNMDSHRERVNSLHKIRKMAEVIEQVRAAIEIEYESIEQREAIKPLLKALSAIH